MRMKTSFGTPDGEKITEKALRKVLVSSICSILMCMACLVSTTWAWFTVSVESAGNEILIGTPQINLTIDGTAFEHSQELSPGTHEIKIEHANAEDDLQKKSTLYVTLMIQYSDGSSAVYTTLDQGNHYSATIQIANNTQSSCVLSWEVSWFAPVNAAALAGSTITLPVPPAAEKAEAAA